jgi:hypothetical protein
MTNTDEKGMLSRWSSRKSAARKAEIETPDTGTADNAPLTDADQVAKDEAAAVREAELKANREAAEAVDLDNVGKTTDIKLFMKDGVPGALRKKALTALWRSDPVLANLDGLNDHDEDYTDAKLVPKVFKSAWETGRGYLKEITSETAADTDKTADAAVATQAESPGEAVEVEEAAASDAAETETTAEEKSAESPHEAVSNYAEDTGIEPDTNPRVSIRRRLSFDESA